MPADNPTVSIIIPVVNNLQYNRECIESIEKHTRDVAYEIVVVDNHSTDGSREYFQGLGGRVRLICNDEIKTFAQSNNQAAGEARGEYLVLLNNDTYVTQGWLSAMLDSISSAPAIGIVGNKHLFPINNRISHAGGVFSEFGPEHIYLYYDSNLPFLNEDREYQWVTAACLLIPKKLYLDIDGFCEEYRNSYEDVDLCLRVKDRGYKIHYCHKSVIYHYGLRTPGRTDNENHNKELFDRKWENKIQVDKEKYFGKDNVPGVLKPDYRLEQYLFHSCLIQYRDRLLEKERVRLHLHIDGLNEAVAIKDRHIDAQDRNIARLTEAVAAQDKHIVAQDRHIERQNEHITAQDRHIVAQAEEIGTLKRQCDNLENLMEAHKKHIEAIYNTLSWRITKPIRLMKQLLTKG